jgi:brefeldin A-inhibited guanine nucleotide-exchange protein
MGSLKFVVSSLDTIVAHAGRNKQLAELAEKALAAIKENDQQLPDPEVVFAPLHLATKSGTIPLATTALDCIGKLISSSYFATPPSPSPAPPPAATTENAAGADDGPPQDAVAQDGAAPNPESQDATPPMPLIERAIDTICDCFQGETTPVEIQLQIVKSLLAAVLNDKIIVHGAGLLKAVRQVYNVFLLSRSTANQQVAQGTLTQMVGTVFERVKTRLHMKEARANLEKLRVSRSSLAVDRTDDQDSQAEKQDGEEATETVSDATPSSEAVDPAAKLTLKDLEHRKSFDDSHMGDGPTMVSQVKPIKKAARSVSGQSLQENEANESPEALEAEDEAYIRDAYLVFRSFCNLSTKILPPDQLYDFRGQPMRSKLLSLHIIHMLLNNHITVFTNPLCTIRNTKSNEPTTFLQAIKYYLCLSLTRNGASSVDRVFDVCCEIFWLMLKYMRASFKVSPPDLTMFHSGNELTPFRMRSKCSSTRSIWPCLHAGTRPCRRSCRLWGF